MDDKEGLLVGVDTKSSIPVLFDKFSNSKRENIIKLGAYCEGKQISHKKLMSDLLYIQDIVNNRLNNNNWLKRHGKPMIRRGHPLYDDCKGCKGLKSSKIIVLDPKKEYERIGGHVINIPNNQSEKINSPLLNQD